VAIIASETLQLEGRPTTRQ